MTLEYMQGQLGEYLFGRFTGLWKEIARLKGRSRWLAVTKDRVQRSHCGEGGGEVSNSRSLVILNYTPGYVDICVRNMFDKAYRG